jgi:hypothetical protein
MLLGPPHLLLHISWRVGTAGTLPLWCELISVVVMVQVLPHKGSGVRGMEGWICKTRGDGDQGCQEHASYEPSIERATHS